MQLQSKPLQIPEDVLSKAADRGRATSLRHGRLSHPDFFLKMEYLGLQLSSRPESQ